jgi:hypothetical protein
VGRRPSQLVRGTRGTIRHATSPGQPAPTRSLGVGLVGEGLELLRRRGPADPHAVFAVRDWTPLRRALKRRVMRPRWRGGPGPLARGALTKG